MFRGAAYSPEFFSVMFQDGMKEIYTEKELKPMLLPATFKLPKNIVLNILYEEADILASGPWDLHNEVMRILGKLMPGQHTEATATRLAATGMRCTAHKGAQEGDIQALVKAVDLTHLGSIADPWASTGPNSVQTALRRILKARVTTN